MSLTRFKKKLTKIEIEIWYVSTKCGLENFCLPPLREEVIVEENHKIEL